MCCLGIDRISEDFKYSIFLRSQSVADDERGKLSSEPVLTAPVCTAPEVRGSHLINISC